jgi:hypothetical protein
MPLGSARNLRLLHDVRAWQSIGAEWIAEAKIMLAKICT